HRIEIAHRAVGDDAGAAEPFMDVALHFSPKRAKPLVGGIDVLDDRDARQRLGGDVLVVGQPHPGRLLPAARMRLARTDQSRPSKGDDRLQLREGGDQRPTGKAGRTACRNDELERVADRWGIEFLQAIEISGFRQVRHGGFLGTSLSDPRLYWEPSRAATPLRSTPRARLAGERLAADPLTDDQQSERDHKRDDEEHDGKAALGTAPLLPVGYPVMHATTPAKPLG